MTTQVPNIKGLRSLVSTSVFKTKYIYILAIMLLFHSAVVCFESECHQAMMALNLFMRTENCTQAFLTGEDVLKMFL